MSRFESKLLGDVKKRKEAAEQQVWTLDQDLREKKMTERVLLYSDKLLQQAAIEWLVATDQPIQALEHPKFKEMIDVAYVPDASPSGGAQSGMHHLDSLVV